MPRKNASEHRLRLRDELWPGSEEEIWRGPREKGYWPAPRVLPLILSLVNDLVGKGKEASLVYLDLLSRDFGQGIVDLRADEADYAYCAGFDSKRARRSWRERVRALEDLGFIRVQSKGPREIAFVLLRHPYIVLRELRAAGKIKERWWSMLCDQLASVGGAWPEFPAAGVALRLPAEEQAQPSGVS